MPVSGAETEFAVKLFRRLPARYDLLAEVLSFAQNRRWRRELVRHLALHRPRTILDVATGTGGVALALAAETEARITGVVAAGSPRRIGPIRRMAISSTKSHHAPLTTSSS